MKALERERETPTTASSQSSATGRPFISWIIVIIHEIYGRQLHILSTAAPRETDADTAQISVAEARKHPFGVWLEVRAKALEQAGAVVVLEVGRRPQFSVAGVVRIAIGDPLVRRETTDYLHGVGLRETACIVASFVNKSR